MAVARSNLAGTLGSASSLAARKGVLMTKLSRRDVLAFAPASVFPVASPALADAPAPFTVNEIVDDGNRFFGTLSRALAEVVQETSSRWGLPNA